MRVLLLKDVYKLGRGGDIKKVADGYGRNYLFPKGLAVLATSGAVKQADRIRSAAETQRSILNQELGGVAEKIAGLTLVFPGKAGETGKLYGSITTAMLAEAITRETGFAADRRQIDCEPIKTLGVHPARLRLTIDLVPTFSVVVHREGEPVESAYKTEVVEEAEDFGELKAALEAEEKAAHEAPRGEGPAAEAQPEGAPAEAEAEGESE
ncbi:MAG TPA: 50S ribosomal protein L9 [Anaerolineales bacterium]|nr:50S ribosomal protein L9 [Anaerolineales bacterium]